jgi:hypothetical protein
MQLALTPAVQQAQDKYFEKHQVVKNAPETDPAHAKPGPAGKRRRVHGPTAAVAVWMTIAAIGAKMGRSSNSPSISFRSRR